MKKFISLFIFLFIFMFIFVNIENLFKYTATSISKNDITQIRVLTDKNLQEMEKNGKIKLKNGHTLTAVNPKQFIEIVKNGWSIIEIDSKKYYIRIYVHSYILELKNIIIYLLILLSAALIMGKKRIKNFLKSAWMPQVKDKENNVQSESKA